MPKATTKYVADDGTEFDRLHEAQHYERVCHLKEEINRCISRYEDDVATWIADRMGVLHEWHEYLHNGGKRPADGRLA